LRVSVTTEKPVTCETVLAPDTFRVGAEVSVGSFLVNFLAGPTIANLSGRRRALRLVFLGRRYGRPLHRFGGHALRR